ncbi:MAG: O-antigen ligase family protein [Alphaproteobacteria bacterium]|nr:O-antigen ligase family protein [Alphaproteobacteria bacterium]
MGAAVPVLMLGKAVMAPFFGFGVLCAGIGLLRLPDRSNLVPGLTTPLARAVYVLIGCLVLSALLSDHRTKSIAMPVRVALTLGAGYLCFHLFVRSRLALMLACKTLVAMAFAALFIVVLGEYFSAVSDVLRRMVGLPTPFDAPRAYKMFASATICLLPIVLWSGWRLGSVWKPLSLVAIPLTGLVVYGDGAEISQSAISGLLGGSILLLLVMIGLRLAPWSRRLLITVVVLLALSVGAYVLTHVPSPPVVENQTPGLPLPDWHRQVIWGFALDVFLHNPLFGVGPNTVNMVPGASDMVPGLNQEYIPAHPHNFVLEIASETGIVGLLALVATLVLLLKMMFQIAARGKLLPDGSRSAAYTGIFLVGAFWTSSLSNFSIWSAWWLASFVLLISFPLAAALPRKQ